jgi:hypothetical protein
MRIRTVKPEFWTSEGIAQHDWDTRLLFIGLWSYVDDNGVGRDVEKLIAADLFPLEDDPRDTLARVSRGLQRLFEAGQITRYLVDERPYLHISSWNEHQRIDRPNKPRYPLPDKADIIAAPIPRESVARVATDEASVPEEQRNRGTEEVGTKDSSSTDVDGPSVEKQKTPSRTALLRPGFAEFWDAYPRKTAKADAERKFDLAVRRIGGDPRAAIAVLVAGARRYAEDTTRKPEFTAHPATWLHHGRWEDQTAVAAPPREKPGTEW